MDAVKREADTEAAEADSPGRRAKLGGKLALSGLRERFEESDEIRSYERRLRTEPCQSADATGLRYRCTWGCPFSTDSRASWLQHEVAKQLQRIWRCTSCKSARRHNPRVPVHITHSESDMFYHAGLEHESSTEDQQELVRRSEVLGHQSLLPVGLCTFTLNNQRVCEKTFKTWEERNDHFIHHFDWWWDRITLGDDLRGRRQPENTDLSRAPMTRLDALHDMSIQPQLSLRVAEAAISNRFCYDSIYFDELISKEMHSITFDVLCASYKRLSIGFRELDRGLIEAILMAMTSLLEHCVILIQSRRNRPQRDERAILRGILEILTWFEIGQQIRATKATTTGQASQDNLMSILMTSLGTEMAATVFSEPRDVHGPISFQYSNPAHEGEYRWLLSVAKQSKSMGLSSTGDCFPALRNCFMSSLKQQVSCDPPEVYHLCTKLDWSPLCAVSDDEAQESSTWTLSGVITLCGDESEGHATTCEEYVKCMWPHFGPALTQCMQGAASSEFGTFSVMQKDIQLTVDCTATRTVVDAHGPAVALLEIFECAAWLGAACRSSQESQGVFIKTLAHSGYGGFLSFDVTYACSTTALYSHQAPDSACWQDMFKNPVMAVGYPVPLRGAYEQGLEMSMPLLTTLGQTYWATSFNGFLLKGYNSIMVPVKRIGDSVIWHFKVRKDGDRMPYTDGHQTSSAFRCYSDAIFPGARHFVGWTHAESTAGTTAVDYTKIKASQTKATGTGVCVEPMLTLQGGQYINVGVNIRRANKDQPVYLPWNLYERQIDTASRWAVVLSDTSTGCHYLVDGATAILHLSLAWLLSGHVRYAPKSAIDNLIVPAINSSETAYHALVDLSNRKLELVWSGINQSWWCFENLAQEYFHVLEQLHDRVSIRDSSEIEINLRKRESIGFDITDLLLETGAVHPWTRKLQSGAEEWLALTTKLKTINILGSNLGDLIKPTPQDQHVLARCRLRDAFPPEQDYLGITLPTVESITGRHCEHTDFALQLADKTYLRDPWSHFAKCVCEQTSLSQCTNLVKKLVSSRGSAGTVSDTHRIYEAYPHGALIFGSHGSTIQDIVNRIGHMEDNNLTTQRSQSSNSQGGGVKRPSSDSGVDVDFTDISSSYPSQQSDIGQATARRKWTIKRVAEKFMKRR